MADFIADPKKPDEQYFLGVDFGNDLGTELLDSFTITDPNNLTDETKNNNSGTIVYFWFTGGSPGDTSDVLVTVEGAAGSVYQKTIHLSIES